MIHGCHAFLPYLARADRAHIVNLSSLFGIIGMPGQAAYCASKFAVRGLSECLSEELRDTTVGLTVVHPGSVRTRIMETADGDDPELVAHVAAWYRAHAYPPDKAAAKIVGAIERGTRRLRITPDAVIGDLAKRLMPEWGNQAFVEVALRTLGLQHMRGVRAEQWQRMVDGE